MANTDILKDIERSVILILAEVSGYPVRKLTELVRPFVAGNLKQGIRGLGILEKRIERLIRKAKLQKMSFRYDEKGTYILHSLTLKHGNSKYYLLLIMELYSGLTYAKAYSRLTRKSLRPAILHTKNGRTRVVVLNSLALELMKNIHADAEPGCPYVFPARTGDGHLIDIRKPLKRAMLRANLVDLRPHDLRRSFASLAVNAGVDIYQIKDLLGHSSVAVTQKAYAHLQQKTLRSASEVVAQTYGEALKQAA